MPTDKADVALHEWAKQYGSMSLAKTSSYSTPPKWRQSCWRNAAPSIAVARGLLSSSCAYFATWARSWRGTIEKFHDYPAFEHVKKQLANRTAGPSFLAKHIETLSPGDEADEEHIKDVKGAAGIFVAAGVDNSSTGDRLCPFWRLPEFEDRERLSYVKHILQETLRWYPAARLGGASFCAVCE